ncbi:hypothetical protein Moror_15606 [Moniliophthora roreri MCA 2997]|uniref:DUF6535 domain-containing protein n=1 Tax=Moniliophthora roreri (strain MCA 2997) TaxID=1381753 RepID=V2WSA2_MONRO|nr:hypothetical protein Moror_15606 [Moniliophthora roreri MCA 2997]
MPSRDLNDGSISGSGASARRLSQESLNPAQVLLPPSFTEPLPREQHADSHSRPVYGRKQKEKERKPTLVESWGKLLQAVMNFDDDMVKNWKEDIDTLLVFAGLFSAVVTAFTIESYQWLVEDPVDITVVLLTQISMQLNASQTASLTRTPFKPDPSSIRINCFWFLSLIFSLTSGLFALLRSSGATSAASRQL